MYSPTYYSIWKDQSKQRLSLNRVLDWICQCNYNLCTHWNIKINKLHIQKVNIIKIYEN